MNAGHEAVIASAVATPKDKLDVRLYLRRIEEHILGGRDIEQVRLRLQKEALWGRLGPPERLWWAQLAQMAEDPGTAMRVLESIHQQWPGHQAAWRHHLELLAMVGPGDAFAGVLARAKAHLEAEEYGQWLKRSPAREIGYTEAERTALEPFERLHAQRAATQRFLDLFAGRRDCFARQWSDRVKGVQGYVPERRPMGPEDVQEHLSGRKTYGIYLMQADGRIQTAVIDADLKKEFRGQRADSATRLLIRREAVYLVGRIKELCEALDAFPLVEFSGAKGYHFWFFFERPVLPAATRDAFKRLVAQIEPDLTAFGLEVFPKQDRPGGKGFGNLVKLPLGLHRLTGKRSFFPACGDRSVAAQIGFLTTVRYSDPERLVAHFAQKDSAEVVLHPRWKQWAETYPSLYQLQAACAPLAQVMGLCLDGGTLSLREEKILYQTIGFLPDGRGLLHYLLGKLPDYNPHLVDYRLSRLRGSPLGCRRIHELLAYSGPVCRFERVSDYRHPLLHLAEWREEGSHRAEKAVNLGAALKELQTAIVEVERFLK